MTFYRLALAFLLASFLALAVIAEATQPPPPSAVLAEMATTSR